MHDVLARLRGGLVVSVQAAGATALDDPHVLSALARAAVAGGAAGVRMQGTVNLRAAREALDVPMIGLIKREYAGFEPYITPTMREVAEIAECGVEIIAFDATARQHPHGTRPETLVAEIQRRGCLAMADCATPGDAIAAVAYGSNIVATTLCGYTEQTRDIALPALDLVRAARELATFVICEGGVHGPDEAAAAREAGADAVVVGTAITNVEWVTRRFVRAMHRQPS